MQRTKLTLKDYQILETGNDGGHRYIETYLDYMDKKRKLTVFFENKADEKTLKLNSTFIVEGIIQDDGSEYDLLLLNSKLIR